METKFVIAQIALVMNDLVLFTRLVRYAPRFYAANKVVASLPGKYTVKPEMT